MGTVTHWWRIPTTAPHRTFGWAAEIFPKSLWLPVQVLDLLVLVNNHQSSEDLAGEQRTRQSGQAGYLQSAAVGTPDGEKEINIYVSTKGKNVAGRHNDTAAHSKRPRRQTEILEKNEHVKVS